ncbi:MAG TPA: hypothetical protein VFB62_11110, partial [Polyangiaceae bacterium]|nr:hypothetical protein [Polyangiaceae bacterium]
SGATLVWGKNDDVLAQPLDAEGRAQGKPVTIARKARAREIAAVGDAGRLAVAWLHVDGAGAEVWAAVRTKDGFEEPVSLGPSEAVRVGRRGHVAVGVGRAGKLIAFHRGAREPCEYGKPEPCASFGMHELPGRGGEPTRPRLAVPKPCEGGVIGVVLAGEHLHYGVCAIDGAQASSTVFTTQPEPPYAQAQELLRGCTPLGMTALDSRDVWVVGSCSGKRTGVLLRGIDAASPMTDLSNVELRCEKERPILALAQNRVLADPVAGIAPLLPTSLAPLGARAVWTGSALIVAHPAAGELTLTRYRCVGGLFIKA